MFQRYLRILLIAATYTSLVHLLIPEHSLKQAALLHVVQVLLPIATGLVLFANRGAEFPGRQTSRYLFASALIVLAGADAFYFTSFYLLKFDGNAGYMVFLANTPYHLVYLLATAGLLLRQTDPAASLRNSKLWLAFGLSFMLSIPFVIYPTYLALSAKMDVPKLITACTALISSVSLLSYALYSFFSSRSLDSTLLACGWFAFGVTDWAIQAEAMRRGGMTISFNSYLWTLAGVITCLPLLFRRSRIELVQPFDEDSLAARMRIRLMLAMVVPLLFLALTLGSTWYGVLSLSFGLVFGTVAITFAIQFVLESIGDVSRALTSMQLADDGATATYLRGIPGEMKTVLFEVMQRTREHEQRESQIRNSAIEERRRLLEQVAHDVRSPLAALEVAAGDAARLPEEQRLLIRGAVGRIRDIANSMLNRVPEAGASDAVSAPASAKLLSSLIDPLITEKRLQFRSRSRVDIEARLDAPSYGIFARVQPVEFKRLMSNLINNAVEAFPDGGGVVRVTLSARDGKALIVVQDDGKGIPADILAKLGRRGETHGKPGGSGLGLYHARVRVESWGGSLGIASDPGQGAVITVSLPQAPAPAWFASELVLAPRQAAVVLDDDASIHRIWDGRLGPLLDRGVEVVHASTPDELRTWVRADAGRARNARYLLDYELAGCEETGLSLAEELALGGRSVLVTSRYEESAIVEECRRLGMAVIPKGMAGLVPIRVDAPADVGARERWDAILIDDDALARATWKIAAGRKGKTFRSFATTADFLKDAPAIDRQTPVYVDSELGDGVKGETEALKIHALGFGEIYLATGHAPQKFAGLAHLRGVVGKEPPWGGES